MKMLRFLVIASIAVCSLSSSPPSLRRKRSLVNAQAEYGILSIGLYSSDEGDLTNEILFEADEMSMTTTSAPSSQETPPGEGETPAPTPAPTPGDTGTPAPTPGDTGTPAPMEPTDCLTGTTKEEFLEEVLSDEVPDFSMDPETPEGEAFDWMVNEDTVDVCTYPTLAQRFALAALFFSTNGPEWTSSEGWLTDAPECEWEFVTCNQDGLVTELDMPNNNLEGILSDAISVLTEMEALVLFDNKLSGGLPIAVGSFANLRLLELEGNSFTGPAFLPEYIGLTEIQEYLVGSNELTGDIPPAIENWTKLTFLSLAENNMSGPIPPEIGSLTELEFLYLSSNEFTGTIPAEMGDLENLVELLAQFNELEGVIPEEFYEMRNIQVLRLDNNNLSGSITPLIGNFDQLTDLRLNNNTFSGSFPAEIEAANQLVFFLLANNTFTGDFPDVYSDFTDLAFFDITNNGFTGGFPKSIFDNPEALRIVYVRQNEFTGPLPATYENAANLRDLFINDNDFTGTVPEISEGSLLQLNEFLLQNNMLTGEMPESICALRNDRGAGILQDLWADCRPPNEDIVCSQPDCCTRCFPLP